MRLLLHHVGVHRTCRETNGLRHFLERKVIWNLENAKKKCLNSPPPRPPPDILRPPRAPPRPRPPNPPDVLRAPRPPAPPRPRLLPLPRPPPRPVLFFLMMSSRLISILSVMIFV